MGVELNICRTVDAMQECKKGIASLFNNFGYQGDVNSMPVGTVIDITKSDGGLAYTSTGKIEKQMGKRGWDSARLEDALNDPSKAVKTLDTRNSPSGGGKNSDPPPTIGSWPKEEKL